MICKHRNIVRLVMMLVVVNRHAECRIAGRKIRLSGRSVE